MTREELEAIRQRLGAATPGPWRWWTSCSYRRLSSDATGKDGDVLRGDIQRHDGHPDVICSETDRALIAHAPADIGALLEAVDRLTAFVDKARAKMRDADGLCRHCEAYLAFDGHRDGCIWKDDPAAQQKG